MAAKLGAVVSLLLVVLSTVACPTRPCLRTNTVVAEEGKLVRVTLDGAPADCDVNWLLIPWPDTVEQATTPAHVFEFIAPAGTYQVVCSVLARDGDRPRLVVLTVTIVVKRAKPAPPEQPAPQPPQPAPPSGKKDTYQAIGVLRTSGGGRCTATHISMSQRQKAAVWLTAAHCVGPIGEELEWRPRRGDAVYRVRLVAKDEQADCAWLVGTALAPELAYAVLASTTPQSGAAVWQAGFGTVEPGVRKDGHFVAEHTYQCEYRIVASPGDSGGAIVWTERDEVLSPVCCGTTPGRYGTVYGATPQRCLAAFNRTHGSDQWPLSPLQTVKPFIFVSPLER